jgi:hypothetical protein
MHPSDHAVNVQELLHAPITKPRRCRYSGQPILSLVPLVKGTKLENKESRILARVFPGMTKFHPGGPRPLREVLRVGGGVRRPCTRFSRRARNNFIEKFCRLEENPDYMLTLTLADSYITDNYDSYPDIEELMRAIKYDFNRWTKDPKVKESLSWYGWRVEFEPRKRGQFLGLKIPHLHVLVKLPPIPSAYEHIPKVVEFSRVITMLTQWHLTVDGCEDHYRVTTHRRSYSKLDGRKQSFSYLSKYCAKTNQASEYIDEETGEVCEHIIGRSWGFSSNAPISQGELFSLPKKTAQNLQRMLRKSVKRRIKESARNGRKYRPGVFFKNQMVNPELKFKMIFPANEILRFVNFDIMNQALDPCQPPAPF